MNKGFRTFQNFSRRRTAADHLFVHVEIELLDDDVTEMLMVVTVSRDARYRFVSADTITDNYLTIRLNNRKQHVHAQLRVREAQMWFS